MVKIEITKRLIGTLSETYFKEFCDQQGWAYISLEQIHENKIKDNILKFKKGLLIMCMWLCPKKNDSLDVPLQGEERQA